MNFRFYDECRRGKYDIAHSSSCSRPSPDHVLDVQVGTRVMLDAALVAVLDEAGGLVGITAIIRASRHSQSLYVAR